MGGGFKFEHLKSGFTIPTLQFAIIGVNKSILERLEKDGFPEGKLYYVPNGTKSYRVPKGVGAAPYVTNGLPLLSLIWVGRLELVKGPDIAILAMAELKRRHGLDHCPVLNVYGAGSMEGYLKEMVSLLCLDDTVRFHGPQPGILERCIATDILVVSSRAETGPLVALEAMSRGMPVVAFRVGEIEEMVPDRRYGHIVADESITALADGIDSMMSDVHTGRFDPDLPISRHQALYSLEKMADRVDEVYKSLMPRNAPVG
jgi:glycosyltransferase involved in cell wall biosynthesis